MNNVKTADWVTTTSGGRGIVKRVAKDGTWADVNWGMHKKRMPTCALIVQHTISVGEFEVTDIQRQRELEASNGQRTESR